MNAAEVPIGEHRLRAQTSQGRTRIKFCGFTRSEDIHAAVALGVDAIGLILVPSSKRALTLEQAARLRRDVPALVQCVALFLDAEADWVRSAMHALRPDLLQFHGREDRAYCEQFNHPYVKALSGQRAGVLLSSVAEFAGASAVLIDAHEPGDLGGSGNSFDWSQLPSLSGPWMLSGGLHSGNVHDAICQLRPFAVDTASGIESAPGIKSLPRMQSFISAVRAADRSVVEVD